MNEKIAKYNMEDSSERTRFFSDIIIFLQNQDHPENPNRKKVLYMIDALNQLKHLNNNSMRVILKDFNIEMIS